MSTSVAYGLKTFDAYGRHAVDGDVAHPYDVFRYVSGLGIHPTRLADDYVGKHALETEHDDIVAYPVVFLDAFRGWVRELPTCDATGWFVNEPIAGVL